MTGNIGANGIELNGSTLHGGYIDFHFGKSSADYTTRLWESSIGKLYITDNNAVKGIICRHISIAYSSIDSIAESGFYQLTGTAGLLIHVYYDINYSIQIMNLNTETKIKWRQKTSGSWGSWTNM